MCSREETKDRTDAACILGGADAIRMIRCEHGRKKVYQKPTEDERRTRKTFKLLVRDRFRTKMKDNEDQT